MTNMEYYGYDNIVFEVRNTSLITELYKGYIYIVILYKAKHSRYRVEVDGLFCKNEDVIEEEVKWLLDEHKFIGGN